MLCHSFKGCALPPSLLFHDLFLSPIQTHKVASTIFWRDNQKIAGLGREILYNIRSPNPTQYWSHWRSWGCPTPVRGSQEVITPQPARESASPRGPRRSSRLDLPRDPILRRPSCLDLPRDSVSRRLSCLSLPGDLHPVQGTPGSQVATVLGRMSLHHVYSRPWWAN